jgi:hypothetical protein
MPICVTSVQVCDPSLLRVNSMNNDSSNTVGKTIFSLMLNLSHVFWIMLMPEKYSKQYSHN